MSVVPDKQRDPAQEATLATTSYAVLGLLTFGPRSGYDLMKLAEKSIGHFWTPAKSHVYAELRRLKDCGHALETEVEQVQRPDKRVYSITPAGEHALRRWLEHSEVVTEQMKSTFTLKVFFGALMPKETLVAQVEEMQRLARAKHDELVTIEHMIENDESFFYPHLTLKQGLAHVEAEIRWTDEVLDELSRREGQ
jgi:PadR family transcriptional regulator, regulatory protein AphA